MLAARFSFLAALYQGPRILLRNLAFPALALLSALVLPTDFLVAAFVILGQAHFAMSMLYQWRAGKANTRYLLILGLGAIAAAAYFSFGGGFTPIFIVTVLCFAAHFAYDEFQLQRCAFGPSQKVTFGLFVFLFGALLTYTLAPEYAVPAFAVSLLFPAYAFVRLFASASEPTRAEAYVWLVGVLLMLLTFWLSAEPVLLLAIISILHITNWYADYGRRLSDSGNEVRHRAYWGEVIVLIAGMTLLYALYKSGAVPLLVYLFNVMYYYAWALVHFALSAASLRRAAGA